MRGDCGIDKRLSERLQIGERAFFVAAHQTAIAGDIRRQHSRQSPFHALAGQKALRISKIYLVCQSIGAGSAGYNVREWVIRPPDTVRGDWTCDILVAATQC
jgi:hypothetical protein